MYTTVVTPRRQALDTQLKFFTNNAFPFHTRRECMDEKSVLLKM